MKKNQVKMIRGTRKGFILGPLKIMTNVTEQKKIRKEITFVAEILVFTSCT